MTRRDFVTRVIGATVASFVCSGYSAESKTVVGIYDDLKGSQMEDPDLYRFDFLNKGKIERVLIISHSLTKQIKTDRPYFPNGSLQINANGQEMIKEETKNIKFFSMTCDIKRENIHRSGGPLIRISDVIIEPPTLTLWVEYA